MLVPNPAKKEDLAKVPLGIHVAVFPNESGTLAVVDVTVKNNGGSAVSEVAVEVLIFQDSMQVADVNVEFSSLEPGDKELVQKFTRVDGYLWNDWTYSYTVVK